MGESVDILGIGGGEVGGRGGIRIGIFWVVGEGEVKSAYAKTSPYETSIIYKPSLFANHQLCHQIHQ